jgi:hypothetical protein
MKRSSLKLASEEQLLAKSGIWRREVSGNEEQKQVLKSSSLAKQQLGTNNS